MRMIQYGSPLNRVVKIGDPFSCQSSGIVSAITGYTTSDYQSIADDAGLTFPNGDWAVIVIAKSNTSVGLEYILSNDTWGAADSFQLTRSSGFFGFKVNSEASLHATQTPGKWYVVCAQRSGTSTTIRSVDMGFSTFSTSVSGTLNVAIDSSNPLTIGGLAGLDGSVSDVIYLPGETVSNNDMQAIATGKAITTFSWYPSLELWAILQDTTGLDQTGNHTVTVTGTLTSTTGPSGLNRGI
ncbi:hypothetical protein [uncultured Paraglaciecola sp.]|uniref:hypothetical protein n=1 Tax=uncultured Paraglaciecola sp. TaxID=1765024 RepID=UPI002601FF0C|nr:hypothetical protein [uncultured Paraglaciecola sp.]